MTELYRLTDEGIIRFQEFIDSQSTTEPESFDLEVATDPRYSEIASEDCDIPETCSFNNRFEAASVLSELIRNARLPDAAHDRGVWCWLSWLWFESICPIGGDGKRKTGEPARWILNLDYNRYYRHILAGPWWIYDAHRDDPDRALALLCTPVTTLGELNAQIAGRQELVSNSGLVGMLTKHFYDSVTGKLRRGISGKGRGSARRLATVINQLDMIWDLYSTSPDEFFELLPSEFDRYK